MKEQWRILLVILFLLAGLVACRRGESAVPASPTPLLLLTTDQPIPVTIAELMADPARYEGAYLQLTGQYRRRPLLVCQSEPHPSPATWGLAEETFLAPAGGYDGLLRPLVAEGLTMTVSGRWQQWQGNVGCGKQVSPSDIWYLEVERLLSPSPITHATLTPASVGEATIIAQLVPTSPGAAVPPIAPPDSEEDSFELVEPTETVPPETGEEEVVPLPPTAPVASPTNTPGVGTGETPATPGTTETTTPPANVTPSPVGTPAATLPAPPNFTVAEQGELNLEFLVTQQLQTNQIHSWSFAVAASETITVTAIAEPNVDLVLSILDAANNVVREQNSVPAGFVETIAGLQLTAAGNYRVHVRTVTGTTAYYSLILMDSSSDSYALQGFINYGDTKPAVLPEFTDHFWHFIGNGGDQITITLTPDDDEPDLFLELYGPDGESLVDFIDDGVEGEEETLTFVLPAPGLYAIRVGENYYEAAGYLLFLRRN